MGKNIINDRVILMPTTDIVLDNELVHIRENEVQELLNMLNTGTEIDVPIKAEFYGNPVTYMWGAPGSGKTTMLKWLEHNVSSVHVRTVMIDCKVHDRESIVLKKIEDELKKLVPETEIEPEIVKLSIKARIVEYVKQLNKQTILMLDEIDKPLNNSNSPQKDAFLHYIIRLVQENPNNMLKIIVSSNIINLEKRLSDEVLSILRTNKVYFSVYSVLEMAEILDKRAKKALNPDTYTKADLVRICRITHEVFMADVRTALDMLGKLAILSKKKLQMEKLDVVITEINQDILQKEISSYPKGSQILLKSIVESMKAKNVGSNKFIMEAMTSEKIYENYKLLCKREGYNSAGIAMFYRYLHKLKNSLVVLKKDSGYILGEDPKKLEKCLTRIL